MFALADQAAGVLDALRAAGVRASLDARDLNPPAVLVTLEGLEHERLDPAYGLTEWALWLTVPDTGTLPTLTAVSTLLDQVAAVFMLEGPTRTDRLPHPDSPDGLPALRTTIRLPITGETR